MIWGSSLVRQHEDFDNLMNGMWMASDDFCKRSDIDGMLIYIGPAERAFLTNTRKAYLIMHAEGAIVAAKNIDIKFSGISVSPISPFEYTRTITLTDNDDEDSPIQLEDMMPTTLKCITCVSQGSMIWVDDEGTSYAELFKSHGSE